MSTSRPHLIPEANGRPEQGAADAVAQLYEEHGRTVLGICRMLLRDPVEAEDASQQAFLSAYRSLLGGTRPEHPAAWLATIARNECWTRTQERMRQPVPEQMTDELVSPLPGPVESAARSADLAALVTAIGALPAQQRDALLMREFSGMSYADLAATLAVSEPAVESLLVRARRELRVRLQPVYAATLVPLFWLRDWLGRVSAGQESVLATAAKVGAVPLAAKLAAGVATVAVVGGVVVAGDADRATRLPADVATVIGVGDASAGGSAQLPPLAVEAARRSDASRSGDGDRPPDGRDSGRSGGDGDRSDGGGSSPGAATPPVAGASADDGRDDGPDGDEPDDDGGSDVDAPVVGSSGSEDDDSDEDNESPADDDSGDDGDSDGDNESPADDDSGDEDSGDDSVDDDGSREDDQSDDELDDDERSDSAGPSVDDDDPDELDEP